MAVDQGHLVLQYDINTIANAQPLLDMEDLFETSANLTVGIYTFIAISWHKWKLDKGFWMWLNMLAVK